MKNLILITLITFSSLNLVNAADKTIIAICSIEAKGSDPSQTLTISYLGGDINLSKNYVAHLTGGNVNNDFSVQEIELKVAESMGLRFANFIIVNLTNGNSDNNSMGVELGAPADKMQCSVKLNLLK